MRKIYLIFLIGLFGCENYDNPKPLIKTGCVCRDGSIIEWRHDILIETNNLTQFPCQSNGGIIKYIYK